MSTPRTSREVHLASRPRGWPAAEDFALVEREVPEPGDGQVVVRNLFMSVDPYMRGRMNDLPSYVPPFEVGAVMDGGAVGEVVASASPDVAEGDVVLHGLGWREYAVADASAVRPVDPAAAPTLSAYLGVLGMPGLTAYAGVTEVARMVEGDTVFVSGAAGAVGSTAGQIARLRGAARVVGSAGSDEKVSYLVDKLGFDAAFNYRDAPVSRQLGEAAPDGVDVYFDNVGGEHLEAALTHLNVGGRVAVCGAISAYNATEPPAAPRNLALVIGKRITIAGFLVRDHHHLRADHLRDVGGWLREGRLTYEETVVDGIDHAPAAFLDMMRGANTGKMVVRLS
ncbi:MAG: NADP-dependent oxidoreductase [Actinomycetes bacterium]